MRAPELPKLAPGTDVMGVKVEEWVDAGGFGTVYRARSPEDLEYALKFIPLAQAGGWAQREAEILIRFKHTNIVRLWGSFFWPEVGSKFMVLKLEFIEGQALDLWARAENPDAREVVRKVLGVARALAVAHADKVVHRDVKEANILVREADGEAVLIDFGAGYYAKALTLTLGLLPPGTPDYRSPEAWRFAEEHEADPEAHYRPDPSDDLYALGVVLYWLLTGKRPFYFMEEEDGVAAILHKPPVPPHVRNPRVPLELSELCLRLLAKRPEERFPDAVELCKVLGDMLAAADERWAVRLQDGPRPVRGKRLPQLNAPLPALEAAPVVEQAPPLPLLPAHPESSSAAVWPMRTMALKALWRAAASVGLLAVGVSLGVFLLSRADSAASVPESQPPPALAVKAAPGQEVAPPGKGPEAEQAAAPFEAESTPAAAASRAALPKDKASVKTRDTPGTPPQQKQQSQGLGPVGKALGTGAACITLACTGAQVRPAPPAEECPPGAVQAMAELRLRIGDDFGGSLDELPREPEVISVREGWTRVYLIGRFKDLPTNAILKGRLLFGGDRVYGRFTEAQEDKGRGVYGRTWPVCMELHDTSGNRGLALKPGSTADTAKVFSSVTVEAVDRFK